jgi:diguanylate cyclase (GGDEF)-like protein/PAS domain S-box-containing protein
LNRIRYKLMAVVGLAVTLSLVATAGFYTSHQEETALMQNERTMHKLTESVIQAVQSVMLAGSADIAQSYADRLKKIPEVTDFRIMRINGVEAFRDNKTILAVNERRGEELFTPRELETVTEVLKADDATLKKVLFSKESVAIYSNDDNDRRTLTFLAPILNQSPCYKCHGKAEPVRGVLKLTTSLAAVERDIFKARQQSLLVLIVAITATMLLTGYMMGRSVVNPIEDVTKAMARVSGGDLNHRVPVSGRDELGRMAKSFNTMTSELKNTYSGLKSEQDKLTTIIQSAGEGIVVTDNSGQVVLVNRAAAYLLDKSNDAIISGGLLNLFDDPIRMHVWLEQEKPIEAEIINYRERIFQVFASTITASDGNAIGSAALFRDITKEKQLEDDLRRLSTTDALTGIFNRRHLDETLQKEFTRSRRTEQPLSVVMFDIDHFKIFNDTHGHDQGDRVLQVVAKTFSAALRTYDVACRYGGEEFLAILPNTTMEGAECVAERMRAAVEAAIVDGLKVTISLGVSTYPLIPMNNPEQMVEAADKAMYRAKQGGRNQVATASAEDVNVVETVPAGAA